MKTSNTPTPTAEDWLVIRLLLVTKTTKPVFRRAIAHMHAKFGEKQLHRMLEKILDEEQV